MIRKKRFSITSAVAALVLFAAGQAAAQTWTNATCGSGSAERQCTENIHGYDYELWNQFAAGNVTMGITGDNGQGANAKGGAFTASWQNTCNILFRSGRKWTNTQGNKPDGSRGDNHTQIGQITVDYEANWSTNDGARMLGIYGWAFYNQDKVPTRRENGQSASFSNQIEYYIIQDRGGYNPAADNRELCNSEPYGEGTIDGILYEFRVCDRIGMPALTGNVNFKQFFSVPKSTSAHRRSGIIDVSAHFNAWQEACRDGQCMYMDGPLYEAAMKIESYACGDGTNNPSNFAGNGSGAVTKNIFTIGNPVPDGNYRLSVGVSPAGAGTVTLNPQPSDQLLSYYAAGTSVELTATPEQGWKFAGWSGDITGTTSPANITMTKNSNVAALFEPTEGNTTNLIQGGDFTGNSLNTAWSLGTGEGWGGSAATTTVSGGSVAINITAVGSNHWEPQLTQVVPLIKGQSYKLTFTASANKDRVIQAQFGGASDPWPTYDQKDFDITTMLEEYEFVFTMDSTTDNAAQFAFNIGQETGTVTISNVKLNYYFDDIPPTSTARVNQTVSANRLITVRNRTISVAGTQDQRVRVRVVDMRGKTVARHNVRGGSDISLRRLPVGAYIVEATRANDGVKTTSRVTIR